MASFGRYQLLQKLGRGGMAEVFLARVGDGPVPKLLAIKRLLPAYSQNKRLVQRLAAEARLTVWLTHPNIVQVFDFGRIHDSYFIAMEFVDGCDLRSLIQPTEHVGIQLPLEVALDIGYRILDALRYAHDCTDVAGKPLGIIHRDISPHNVLISRDGHSKLADFGVARAVSSDRHTQPGAVLGKFSYMAPEQARGKAYDARIDVYAAGAMLYQMLTGSKPFPDRTLEQAITNAMPPAPSSLRPSIPRPLDELVLQAMTADPRDRFDSAARMADAVLEQLEAVGGPPKPHQVCKLVEETLKQREAARARRKTGETEPRATLSDIIAGDDSLIGEEVTRVQRHLFLPAATEERPIGPMSQTQTRDEPALPPTAPWSSVPAPPLSPAAPDVRPTPPPDGLSAAARPAPPPDGLSAAAMPAPPTDAPAPNVTPPPASPVSSPTPTDGAVPGTPPSFAGPVAHEAGSLLRSDGREGGTFTARETGSLAMLTARSLRWHDLSHGVRLWAIGGLGVSAALIIFGLGLLVGRATVGVPPPRPCTPATAIAAPRPVPAALHVQPTPTSLPATPRAVKVTLRRPDPAPEPRVRPARRTEPRRHPRARRSPAVEKNEPAAGPVRRPLTDPQWRQAIKLLKRAQKAYIEGDHRAAVSQARQVVQLIPDSMGAWQIIAASSCYMKNPSEARQAARRVDTTRRVLVEKICRRNGIQL